MFDIFAIFRKKQSPLEKETLLSENQKKEIDATWGLLEEKMSGLGCMKIVANTQPDDLAIALLHSDKQIISHFEISCTGWEKFRRKYGPLWEKAKASMTTHKNCVTEEDSYKMKSHIINTHKAIFRDLVYWR
ncbi:hypothetical protein AGMMS49944_28790 [Spirochaetia bacterium]|nr:hypothetical protein AGMMS49944_28790 [Spirochaetia bacterium]